MLRSVCLTIHASVRILEQLLNWSFWAVEARLSLLQRMKEENMLRWARNMAEFRDWRTSRTDSMCKERILLIRGTLGIGKSLKLWQAILSKSFSGSIQPLLLHTSSVEVG